MKQLQAGDPKGFEMLYSKYKTPLYSYFMSHCHDVSLSEDLLQECFMKLLKNCHSFRFESKLSTWIWTLARHQMVDHWRSAGHQMDQGKLEPMDSEEFIEKLESPMTGPEEKIMEASEEKQVKECIDELPLQQKDAILLRAHGELSYEEIASQLETTVSAVKSLLVRAKNKLLECLKQGGHA